MIRTYLNESILKRATESGILVPEIINIRDFSADKHKRTDDYPYGGGVGMLMTPQPLADAIRSVDGYQQAEIIYPNPTGKIFKQDDAEELASLEKDLIFICGRYEGIDQRVIDKFVTREYSIGDYVLTGGELPALVIADSVSRQIDGILGNSLSSKDESLTNNLLEYPQYTRPYEFEGMKVPDILVSGHHKKIAEWQKEQSILKTKQRRADLYQKFVEKESHE